MRKYQLVTMLAEQDGMIADLQNALDEAKRELGQIKNTIIRVNAQTDLGVRPIYQAELTYAIVATKAAGGGGIISAAERANFPQIVEVVSEWQPPHFYEPSVDRLEMDELAALPEPNFYEADYPGREE